MDFKVNSKKYTLDFKFDAGTSRGILKTRDVWFVTITDGVVVGIGEAGPLKGLSIDDRPDFEIFLNKLCEGFSDIADLKAWVQGEESLMWPSIRFAVETAVKDFENGGQRVVFNTGFVDGQMTIPINGLVWMSGEEEMKQQAVRKVNEGYEILKFKVGALDFEAECRVLEFVRNTFPELEIRLDANGAFNADDVIPKLDRLSEFEIHSIEQPVRQGQWDLMKKVCSTSIIPVALDEELIGVYGKSKKELLDFIEPAFIILKPSLLGGFASCDEWIKYAEQKQIDWWMTSALESNIGLNAIAQYTSTYTVVLPQGLGTGQLFYNNIDSPLVINMGGLRYGASDMWDLKNII